MKYFNFDVVKCYKDYPQNQITATLQERMMMKIQRRLKHPADTDEAHRRAWEVLLKEYSIKYEEYSFYCMLIEDGRQALSEVERNILDLWLWDEKNPQEICIRLNIKDEYELNRIKRIALMHLSSAVSVSDFT